MSSPQRPPWIETSPAGKSFGLAEGRLDDLVALLGQFCRAIPVSGDTVRVRKKPSLAPARPISVAIVGQQAYGKTQIANWLCDLVGSESLPTGERATTMCRCEIRAGLSFEAVLREGSKKARSLSVSQIKQVVSQRGGGILEVAAPAGLPGHGVVITDFPGVDFSSADCATREGSNFDVVLLVVNAKQGPTRYEDLPWIEQQEEIWDRLVLVYTFLDQVDDDDDDTEDGSIVGPVAKELPAKVLKSKLKSLVRQSGFESGEEVALAIDKIQEHEILSLCDGNLRHLSQAASRAAIWNRIQKELNGQLPGLSQFRDGCDSLLRSFAGSSLIDLPHFQISLKEDRDSGCFSESSTLENQTLELRSFLEGAAGQNAEAIVMAMASAHVPVLDDCAQAIAKIRSVLEHQGLLTDHVSTWLDGYIAELGSTISLLKDPAVKAPGIGAVDSDLRRIPILGTSDIIRSRLREKPLCEPLAGEQGSFFGTPQGERALHVERWVQACRRLIVGMYDSWEYGSKTPDLTPVQECSVGPSPEFVLRVCGEPEESASLVEALRSEANQEDRASLKVELMPLNGDPGESSSDCCAEIYLLGSDEPTQKDAYLEAARESAGNAIKSVLAFVNVRSAGDGEPLVANPMLAELESNPGVSSGGISSYVPGSGGWGEPEFAIEAGASIDAVLNGVRTTVRAVQFRHLQSACEAHLLESINALQADLNAAAAAISGIWAPSDFQDCSGWIQKLLVSLNAAAEFLGSGEQQSSAQFVENCELPSPAPVPEPGAQERRPKPIFTRILEQIQSRNPQRIALAMAMVAVTVGVLTLLARVPGGGDRKPGPTIAILPPPSSAPVPPSPPPPTPPSAKPPKLPADPPPTPPSAKPPITRLEGVVQLAEYFPRASGTVWSYSSDDGSTATLRVVKMERREQALLVTMLWWPMGDGRHRASVAILRVSPERVDYLDGPDGRLFAKMGADGSLLGLRGPIAPSSQNGTIEVLSSTDPLTGATGGRKYVFGKGLGLIESRPRSPGGVTWKLRRQPGGDA